MRSEYGANVGLKSGAANKMVDRVFDIRCRVDAARSARDASFRRRIAVELAILVAAAIAYVAVQVS